MVERGRLLGCSRTLYVVFQLRLTKTEEPPGPWAGSQGRRRRRQRQDLKTLNMVSMLNFVSGQALRRNCGLVDDLEGWMQHWPFRCTRRHHSSHRLCNHGLTLMDIR